jgi:uncharacterized membrane protein
MAARRARLAVGAAVGAVIAATAGALAGSGGVATSAGVLMLVLPGPVLAEAVVGTRDLKAVERVGWWVAAEFVTLIAAGLLLAEYSAVTRAGWLWTLAAVTCFAAGAVIWRSRTTSSAVDDEVAGGPVSPLRRGLLVTVMTVSVALLITAITVSVKSAQHQPRPTFTELWMLPAPHGNAVDVGIHSHENHPVAYRLVLTAGGRTVQTWDVTLASGAEWERRSTTPPSAQIAARLYVPGRNDAYRMVSLASGPPRSAVTPR